MAESWQLPGTSPQKAFCRVEALKRVSRGKIAFWQVCGGVTDGLMIFQYELFKPGADSGMRQLREEARESGFLISGRIEVTVGEERRIMERGEPYYFSALMPHWLRVIGSEPDIMVSCTRRRVSDRRGQ